MTVTITEDLVETVRQVAERAAVEIMRIYESDFSVDRKNDQSPVTEADRQAEQVIISGLRSQVGSEWPIVAEEEVAAGRTPTVGDRSFWLVDPLDGTKQFVSKQGEFTVNIALIVDGRPILGVVLAPAIGSGYWGSPLGAFAVREGGTIQPIRCRPMPKTGLIAVASRSHRTPETDAYLSQFDIAGVTSAGSSIKFCQVASGEADLYPRAGRTMEWDTAAGHAVVLAAGGRVVTMAEGSELVYGKPGFENPHFVVKGAPSTS